jgi:sugar phosphate isomerase/epimerase
VKRVRSALAGMTAAGMAAVAVAASPAAAQTAPGCVPGTIPKDKISFQLYNFLLPVFGSIPIGPGQTFPPNTPPNTQEQMQAAVKNVFAQMKANGFSSFENFNGTFGYSDADYRKLFESYGLHAVADHGAVDTGTWDARLDQAQTLGLKYVGSGGWPNGTSMTTVEGALNMASVLNDLGRKARARGLWVYGHNHVDEFATKLAYDVNGDGVKEQVPALEVVMLNTDPSLVTFEIDVHWALEGLKYNTDELVAFLRKYSKRISMLHVKGSNPNGGGAPTPALEFARITDAGGPNDFTDWKRIFAAAADVDYYHWEYDLPPDAFASAKIASNLLNCVTFGKVRDESGGVGGTVPATLALTLGASASFGAFQPGVAKDYTASTTANVISSAGDATLSVADPSTTAPGHLVNGTFSLPQAVQAGVGGAFAPVGAAPASLKTWTGPTSNESVKVDFKQSIGASDALRTGAYGKTLTFTLSTTTP